MEWKSQQKNPLKCVGSQKRVHSPLGLKGQAGIYWGMGQ